MEPQPCLGREGRLSQYDEPVWEPLVQVVGERLAVPRSQELEPTPRDA
jgi:hypothetical protein